MQRIMTNGMGGKNENLQNTYSDEQIFSLEKTIQKQMKALLL